MRGMIVSLALIALFSCEKEEVQVNNTQSQTETDACKCGIVQSQQYVPSLFKWIITVDNNCTSNSMDFQELNAKDIGSVYCTNQTW